MLKTFFKPGYLDFETLLIMSSFVLFMFFLFYLIKDSLFKESKLNSKKRIYKFSNLDFDFENIRIREYKRKYDIIAFFIKDNKISFESFTILMSLIFSLIYLVFFFMIKATLVPLGIILGIPTGIIISIMLINDRYNKRKRKFENSFPDIGLIINQCIQNENIKKEIYEIIEKIIDSKKSPASEEFKIIKYSIDATGDVKKSLNLITERYNDSIYLPQLVNILELYYETKKDISALVNLTIDQIRDAIQIKKQIEIQIKPYINTILGITFIASTFIFVNILINKISRKFYSSKIGIIIFVSMIFIMLIGFLLIHTIKIGVVKDEAMFRKKY